MEIRIYRNDDFVRKRQFYLQPKEVHIWCIQWNELLDYWEKHKKVLNLQELEKAERFYFYEDRMRYLAGKVLSKQLLMQYLDEEEIVFFTHKLGKTYHKPITGKQNIEFNISHSGNMLLAAFARNMDIGVDVQEMAECQDYRKIAKNFFAPSEAEYIEKRKDETLFFRFWAAKEAYLKAIGIGINQGMDFFSVTNGVIKEHGKIKQDWWLIPLELHGYAAYVAVHERKEKK